LHLDNDSGGVGCDEGRIARHLDRVAEALVRMQQDRLSREARFAEPQRLAEIAREMGHLLALPAPFVQAPAFLEFAEQQVHDRFRPLRLGELRREGGSRARRIRAPHADARA
jgi:hypothetical protein